MNRVFVALVCSAVLAALLRDALPSEVATQWFATSGPSAMKAVTNKILEAASDAARLALGLVGVLALWTGVMRVAEEAGLVALLARAFRPVLMRLFPEVPADHPAMGAIVMNMSANALGLGNAATPLGLEAMKRLQELNPHKRSATDAMVLFLALNTTHITLIPARTIALRLENGSQAAANIVLPTLLATACGMLVALVAAKALQRRFPVEPSGGPEADRAPVSASNPTRTERNARPRRSNLFAVALAGLGVAAAVVAWSLGAARLRALAGHASDAAIPVFILMVVLVGAARGVKVYEVLVEGAKQGFETAVRIIPYLVAVLVAVGMVRAAGLLDLVAHAFGPALAAAGVPPETLPMMLIRPLSGSGADGVMVDLMKAHGADSVAATTAAVMSGATDTTFYVLAVYFGSVGIERIRHALWAGLLGDLTGLLAAAWLTEALLFAQAGAQAGAQVGAQAG